MPNTRFQQYLEAEVLGADPIKLVTMLYRGALDAVTAARRSLGSGLVSERSRQITKAWEIVHELNRSLDSEQGGQLSRNLAELYVYIQQRLLDANARQADEPLAEVEKLLATLWEAWRGLTPAAVRAPAVADVYEPVSCEA